MIHGGVLKPGLTIGRPYSSDTNEGPEPTAGLTVNGDSLCRAASGGWSWSWLLARTERVIRMLSGIILSPAAAGGRAGGARGREICGTKTLCLCWPISGGEGKFPPKVWPICLKGKSKEGVGWRVAGGRAGPAVCCDGISCCWRERLVGGRTRRLLVREFGAKTGAGARGTGALTFGSHCGK